MAALTLKTAAVGFTIGRLRVKICLEESWKSFLIKVDWVSEKREGFFHRDQTDTGSTGAETGAGT